MEATMTLPPAEIGPGALERRRQDLVLVDVREDFEFATERIDEAWNHPLSGFDADAVRERAGDRPVCFYCRTGRRSGEALALYAAGDAIHLAGGIEAWKEAGLGTVRDAGAPRIDVMRQVQMTAGSLVLAGVLLGVSLSPWFLVVSGFVGSGLIFAGASGWCGMAKLLGKMPWNRRTIRCEG